MSPGARRIRVSILFAVGVVLFGALGIWLFRRYHIEFGGIGFGLLGLGLSAWMVMPDIARMAVPVATEAEAVDQWERARTSRDRDAVISWIREQAPRQTMDQLVSWLASPCPPMRECAAIELARRGSLTDHPHSNPSTPQLPGPPQPPPSPHHGQQAVMHQPPTASGIC